MRIHGPKLCHMAQALSLSVSIAFEGTNVYILLFHQTANRWYVFFSQKVRCKQHTYVSSSANQQTKPGPGVIQLFYAQHS